VAASAGWKDDGVPMSNPEIRVRRGLPPSTASKTGSQEADSLSAARSDSRRYGMLTVVLSPEFVMVKVPDVDEV
jgi:hypothetical protein